MMVVCYNVPKEKSFLTVFVSGLLCVTCTDLSVLATTNYPEKWCAF